MAPPQSPASAPPESAHAESAAPGSAAPGSAAPGSAAKASRDESWPAILPQLGVSGIPLELGSHCALQAIEGNVVKLALTEAFESLLQERAQRQLTQAFSTYLGREVSLRITPTTEVLETPFSLRQQAAAERQQEAEAAIAADPLVQKLCEQLDGVVQSESVKPNTD